MIGEAWSRPARGVSQRIFLPVLVFHSMGKGFVVSTPEPCGPRNCGQSAAWPATDSAAKAAIKRCFGMAGVKCAATFGRLARRVAGPTYGQPIQKTGYGSTSHFC